MTTLSAEPNCNPDNATLVQKLQEKSYARREVLLALSQAAKTPKPETLEDAIAVLEYHGQIAAALREFFAEDEQIDRQLLERAAG